MNATSIDSWLACSCSVWFGSMYMSSQVALMLLRVFGTPELMTVSVGRFQAFLTLGVSTRYVVATRVMPIDWFTGATGRKALLLNSTENTSLLPWTVQLSGTRQLSSVNTCWLPLWPELENRVGGGTPPCWPWGVWTRTHVPHPRHCSPAP